MNNPLAGLFRSRDKPGRRAARNSLNGSGYSFFFGGTTSGKVVNERSAMQMSTAEIRGTLQERSLDLGERGWDISETYGVLENLDAIEAFTSAVKEASGAHLVFIVTDDESAFQMVCRELPESVVPVRLYESYLQNFEINIGRSL